MYVNIRMLANTITPAMFGAACYLFVANTLIGVFEGIVLRRWFKAGRRAIWWMILANYLSAWLGWYAVASLILPRMDLWLGPRPIERATFVACIFFAATFVVSVIIESFLVFVAIKRENRGVLRALSGSLAANAITYPLIALWFMLISFTLPLNARVVAEAELGPMPRGTLYWIDPQGRVMARALDRPGDSPREVGKTVVNDFVYTYQLRVKREGNSVWIQPMYNEIRYSDRNSPADANPPTDPVLKDVGSVNAFPTDYWDQSRMLRKSVLDLRPVDKRGTTFVFDWYRHTLSSSVPGGRSSRLVVGWAGMDWTMAEPTVLLDDKVVFEWAAQIVIFDPRSGKLAFVALGTCPAVVPAD